MNWSYSNENPTITKIGLENTFPQILACGEMVKKKLMYFPFVKSKMHQFQKRNTVPKSLPLETKHFRNDVDFLHLRGNLSIPKTTLGQNSWTKIISVKTGLSVTNFSNFINKISFKLTDNYFCITFDNVTTYFSAFLYNSKMHPGKPTETSFSFFI